MLRRLASVHVPQLQTAVAFQQACQQQLVQLPYGDHAQQLQQTALYSQHLNPKQAKKQAKKDKKQQKQESTSIAGGAEATSFTEDGAQVLEADVTKLVLQAIHNVTPLLDVRPIRTATKVSYVPGLMPPKKARSLALHWLVKAADARAKNSRAGYAECLALELLLAYQKKGPARQKRDDIHKLALQNRANIHLRWW